MATAMVFVFDFGDPVALEAAKEAARQFANLFVLQASPLVKSLKLAVCSLHKPAHVTKVQLQVKQRPAELSLRDFHVALGKIQCGTSSDGVDGSQAAQALYSLLQLSSSDKELSTAQHRSILTLTDRQYDVDDFVRVMQPAKERGIALDLYFTCPAGGMEAAAGTWPELEAQFPNLSVTVIESPGREAFRGLTALLLERYARLQPVAVSLQFKVPLVGEVRSLQLSARPAMLRMSTAVEHAPVCSCHKLPGLQGAGGAFCIVTGEPLSRAASRDARTIQLGPSHPGGLLHFATPFNIMLGPAGQATLTVMQRVKREQLNPACMCGTPLQMEARDCQFKFVHEGELHDVSHHQLLHSLTDSLRDAGELLIASTTASLETGQAGLFRQFYALCPDSSGRPLMHASRIATAEELPAPAAAAVSRKTATQLPVALSEAVRQQLGQVQLGAFDPLAYSSRCHETIEMLVLESKPPPKPQPLPPTQPAARQPGAATAAGAGEPLAAGAGVPALGHQLPPLRPAHPIPGKAAGDVAHQGAQPAAAAGKGRKGPINQAAAGRAQQSGRGGLDLKRTQR